MISEEEIVWKVLQALELTNGQLTEGMLERHLTSKVSASTRKAVVAKMHKSDLIRIEDRPINSYKGYAVTVRLIKSPKKDDT